MTAIIFGANGQDGYYLSELLKGNNIEVIKLSRETHPSLINYKDLLQFIELKKPAYIFHLAANSTTNHAAVFENHETICTGTINILEAVKNFSPKTKVFISGSGLQFVNNNNPIKESDAFEARDAYSVSRIHSVYAARYYRRLGLNVYVGYFFNHDSPKRTERHMAKKITLFANKVKNESTEKLEIGDVSVIKEWTFAGDVVNGIWTLVNQNDIFEANIGSGKGYSIQDWLEVCFNHIGKDWKEYISINRNFIPEYKSLVCNPSLINSIGWQPQVSFEELAKMMMQE